MSNYEFIKNALEKKGELMIKTDNGEKFELHKHNVKFNDDNKIIEIDGGDQVFWLDSKKIAYYWIHKEARDSS